MSSLICAATTKSGKPCTNGAVDSINGTPYCGVHIKSARKDAQARRGDVQQVGTVAQQIVSSTQPTKEVKSVSKINVVAQAQTPEPKAEKAARRTIEDLPFEVPKVQVEAPEGAISKYTEMLQFLTDGAESAQNGAAQVFKIGYLAQPYISRKSGDLVIPLEAEVRAIVPSRVRERADEETGEVVHYVHGYETKAKAYRSFRLDNIRWVEFVGDFPFIFAVPPVEFKHCTSRVRINELVTKYLGEGYHAVIPSADVHWKREPQSIRNPNIDTWTKQGFIVLGAS